MIVAIVSCKGFWQNGWLPDVNTVDHFARVLAQQGVEVQSFEVEHVTELNAVLSGLDPKTLVLPNAYHVLPDPRGEETGLLWLGDVIAAHSLESIGPQAACLKQLLQKHVCQRILQENGIPVPEFCCIAPEDTERTESILQREKIAYPAIVKLTGESSGVGISQDSIVNDVAEAVEQIRKLHRAYRQVVIVETFLPGTEFTAARFEANGEALHLVAEYQVENHAILGQEERSIPWGEGRRMVKVENAAIVEEIEGILDRVWKVLDIKDVFRLDGRLDQNGRFRVFDVNGFPALAPQQSATPILSEACFLHFPTDEVYRMLANTIVLCAAERQGMPIHYALLEHNFFKAASRTVMEYGWA